MNSLLQHGIAQIHHRGSPSSRCDRCVQCQVVFHTQAFLHSDREDPEVVELEEEHKSPQLLNIIHHQMLLICYQLTIIKKRIF
jgi:hypothetical protein